MCLFTNTRSFLRFLTGQSRSHQLWQFHQRLWKSQKMGDCNISAAGAVPKSFQSFPPCLWMISQDSLWSMKMLALMWTMFVFCHADLQKDDTVCNYIVQTYIYIYVCLVIIECTVCVDITVWYVYIYMHYTYGHRHNYGKNILIAECSVFNCSGVFYNYCSWSSHSSKLVGTLGRAQLWTLLISPRICRAQRLNLIGQRFQLRVKWFPLNLNVSGWPKGLMFIFLPIRWDQGRADV